ncbi:MAG: hypothetical protein KAT05_02335 [Spirochaetes bacterium]|nr:hypothetical protein [Spirochaetota bacterium]
MFQKRYDNLLKTNINFKDFLYNPIKTKLEIGVSFDYMDKLKRLKFKKEENPIRRASILFFGSLTFATFGGWLFFSLFNVLIYDETFGKLRREQFLILYLGTGVISISVVLSDLFINLKPKMKRVEIY